MNYVVTDEKNDSIECWLEKGEEGIVEFHVGDYIIAGLNKNGELEIYDGIGEGHCGLKIDAPPCGSIVTKKVPFWTRFPTWHTVSN